MSHTTQAALGTVFIHNGDYSGAVRILPHGLTHPHAEVVVPFEDLRELVFGCLRMRLAELAEASGDSEFETWLLRGREPQ